MEFERIPTVPTADEILDRSFRRAASKMRLKRNKDRANEEFVRAVSRSIHDRLVQIIRSFPELNDLPPFYRDIVDIMWGMDRVKVAGRRLGCRWAQARTRPCMPDAEGETPSVIARGRWHASPQWCTRSMTNRF